MAYFAQHQAEALVQERTVMEETLYGLDHQNDVVADGSDERGVREAKHRRRVDDDDFELGRSFLDDRAGQRLDVLFCSSRYHNFLSLFMSSRGGR